MSHLTAYDQAGADGSGGDYLRRRGCTPLRSPSGGTPLNPDLANSLQAWYRENPELSPEDPVFPAQGTRRPMTTEAVTQRLAIHTKTAAPHCATLATKKITPRIAAVTIPLWLGHESIESTRAYMHADMSVNNEADRTAPASTYKPSDGAHLTFLENL